MGPDVLDPRVSNVLRPEMAARLNPYVVIGGKTYKSVWKFSAAGFNQGWLNTSDNLSWDGDWLFTNFAVNNFPGIYGVDPDN